ncbi:EamA/RhaT family transporter [Moraxella sp. K127]|uniref:EamA/RhaT family transporter n=1 Tax=Moraxella TaxID=475 RepID=UPI0018823B1B|nr:MULTISPECIES: EamA/RhaT family transporter [unclassified Moraxella]MBE9579282.1 EamA/RhaT family transporter [Moraxella sp. K1664]MBE9591725.1 EamA/RhaT family transporter [Moraxella sp. K127]
MIFLISAICASVLVSIFLKVARRQGIDISQAILVNYITAIILCIFLLKPSVNIGEIMANGAFIVIALGVLLPSVFIIMAKAVQLVGIAKSDVAQRLALFLPILASFTIFGESLTLAKGMGIILAFSSLIALTYKPNHAKTDNSLNIKNTALILGGVWAGYGVIDILFKQMAKLGNAFPNTLLVSFILAFVLLFIYLIINKTKWQGKSLISGILLGALNFFNILFYIKAHQAYKDDPTLVFAGMNIGVICLGAVVGLFIFKEKISKINGMGIILGVCAVWCLFYLT